MGLATCRGACPVPLGLSYRPPGSFLERAAAHFCKAPKRLTRSARNGIKACKLCIVFTLNPAFLVVRTAAAYIPSKTPPPNRFGYSVIRTTIHPAKMYPEAQLGLELGL